MNTPIDCTKEPYLRFTDAEIDGFLRFLLEGGADKRCSNVYRIIEQQKLDLAEAKRLLRSSLAKLEAYKSHTKNEYPGGPLLQKLLPDMRRFIEGKHDK